VLTSERWTPLAFGNAQHTVMAEVQKTQSPKDSGQLAVASGQYVTRDRLTTDH
jgi:hypothetical protein